MYRRDVLARLSYPWPRNRKSQVLSRKLEGIIPLATLPGLHHQYARICFAIGTALESSIHRLGFNNVERQRLCCVRFSRVVERILQHLAIEMDIVARHPR